MAFQLGDIAPRFTLFNSEKKKIALIDYLGKKKVLLLFFPLAFTRVCTEELCAIRDNILKYDNENTEVLGLSVDSVYALAKYKEEQQFNYHLLSDFNREVSSAYGCLYSKWGEMELVGVSKRSAFIIDKNGLIQYSEILERATDVPDFEAIDLKLASLP